MGPFPQQLLDELAAFLPQCETTQAVIDLFKRLASVTLANITQEEAHLDNFVPQWFVKQGLSPPAFIFSIFDFVRVARGRPKEEDYSCYDVHRYLHYLQIKLEEIHEHILKELQSTCGWTYNLTSIQLPVSSNAVVRGELIRGWLLEPMINDTTSNTGGYIISTALGKYYAKPYFMLIFEVYSDGFGYFLITSKGGRGILALHGTQAEYLRARMEHSALLTDEVQDPPIILQCPLQHFRLDDNTMIHTAPRYMPFKALYSRTGVGARSGMMQKVMDKAGIVFQANKFAERPAPRDRGHAHSSYPDFLKRPDASISDPFKYMTPRQLGALQDPMSLDYHQRTQYKADKWRLDCATLNVTASDVFKCLKTASSVETGEHEHNALQPQEAQEPVRSVGPDVTPSGVLTGSDVLNTDAGAQSEGVLQTLRAFIMPAAPAIATPPDSPSTKLDAVASITLPDPVTSVIQTTLTTAARTDPNGVKVTAKASAMIWIALCFTPDKHAWISEAFLYEAYNDSSATPKLGWDDLWPLVAGVLPKHTPNIQGIKGAICLGIRAQEDKIEQFRDIGESTQTDLITSAATTMLSRCHFQSTGTKRTSGASSAVCGAQDSQQPEATVPLHRQFLAQSKKRKREEDPITNKTPDGSDPRVKRAKGHTENHMPAAVDDIKAITGEAKTGLSGKAGMMTIAGASK